MPDGNVGIKTPTPYQALHVLTSGTSGYDSGANRGILITDSFGPRFVFEDTSEGVDDKVIVIYYENEILRIAAINDDGTAWIDQNLFVLNRDGNLGLGAPSEGQKLEISGNLRVSNGGYSHIFLTGHSATIGSEANTDALTIGDSTLQAYLLMPGTNRGGTEDGSFLFTSRYDAALESNANIKFRTYNGSVVTELAIITREGKFGVGTPDPDARFDVHGDARLGDSDDGNYLNVSSVGVITLVGSARVTRDLWIDAAGIKAPGAKPATEVAFGTLEVSAWEFSNEGVGANQESVSWRMAIPYDMDRSVGPSLRVGWSSASTGNCRWQLKYRWFSEDEDLTQDGEETLTATDAASATANGLVVTDITGIDAPSGTDATIMFKLTRLSADAADTISDTVELHGVCFNYTSNKLGDPI